MTIFEQVVLGDFDCWTFGFVGTVSTNFEIQRDLGEKIRRLEPFEHRLVERYR